VAEPAGFGQAHNRVRDTPVVPFHVFACVEGAQRRHQPPGPRCALPRKRALLVDPAVEAAQRLGSSRVRVIDMTHYLCGDARCDPVIGGALVYKDETHLTRVYARTLGPYLQRRVDQLVRSDGIVAGLTRTHRALRSRQHRRSTPVER
jgi:hypothetical protein